MGVVVTEDCCKGLDWEREVMNEGGKSSHLRFHTPGGASGRDRPTEMTPEESRQRCKVNASS